MQPVSITRGAAVRSDDTDPHPQSHQHSRCHKGAMETRVFGRSHPSDTPITSSIFSDLIALMHLIMHVRRLNEAISPPRLLLMAMLLVECVRALMG